MKKTVYFEAYDGTLFESELLCREYELSFKSHIFEEYKKLVKGSFNEYDLFDGFGSDQYGWDIVYIKSIYDLRILNSLFEIYNIDTFLDETYIGTEFMTDWHMDSPCGRITTIDKYVSFIEESMRNTYRNSLNKKGL